MHPLHIRISVKRGWVETRLPPERLAPPPCARCVSWQLAHHALEWRHMVVVPVAQRASWSAPSSFCVPYKNGSCRCQGQLVVSPLRSAALLHIMETCRGNAFHMCWSLLVPTALCSAFSVAMDPRILLVKQMRHDGVERALRARWSMTTARDGKRISAALAQLRRTARCRTPPRSEHGER